jgi:hypothetical protein
VEGELLPVLERDPVLQLELAERAMEHGVLVPAPAARRARAPADSQLQEVELVEREPDATAPGAVRREVALAECLADREEPLRFADLRRERILQVVRVLESAAAAAWRTTESSTPAMP